MNSESLKNGKFPGVIVLAAFIIVIAGVMQAQSIVTPMLMALFTSIVCAQPITWLEKKGIPKGIAIILVFTAIIAIIGGFGELVTSSLSSFSDNSALYQKNIQELSAQLHTFLDSHGADVPSEQLTELVKPGKVMGFTAGILTQLGGFMGNTLTIIFLVLFMLFELDSFALKARAIANNTNITLDYLTRIGQNIRHYLSIKTMTSLITGGVIWIGLLILGVDYAVIWGLIAFLLNYIPNIGSILAAVPAVLFASIQLGLGGAIWTTVIFVIVNMAVGNVIEPKLLGRGMGLSTFVVLVALIFWGFVLGTVGMFLSVPLTMAIKIVLEQNPRTKWVAVLLGTDEDAQNM